MTKKNLWMALLATSALLASCGIKGPPLPPIDEQSIQKQRSAEALPVKAETASADTTKAKQKK